MSNSLGVSSLLAVTVLERDCEFGLLFDNPDWLVVFWG